MTTEPDRLRSRGPGTWCVRWSPFCSLSSGACSLRSGSWPRGLRTRWATRTVAAAVYDALTRFLSTSVRMVVVVGPALALLFAPAVVEFLAADEDPGPRPGLTRTA